MYTGLKLVHFSVWQKSGQVFIVQTHLDTTAPVNEEAQNTILDQLNNEGGAHNQGTVLKT
jgi:hypothetical protein